MHLTLGRGVRRAGARLILLIIFLFTLPGCLWEGSGATLTPPVTGGTAQAVTLVTQDNAPAFAQVVTSALNKTLIVGKIANDATSAVAPDICNNSDPGVSFVGCRQGMTPFIPSAFNFVAVPPQSSTNTASGPVTGTCDAASPNASSAAAGTYTITASYADPAFTPPPGALYQVSVGNTLDVQFSDCVIRGVDMDGGFHVTNLTFDDNPFTADNELASGWIIFDGLVIRNVGHETSFNSWDGGSGQKYISFTTSEVAADGAIRTEMTTGDTVLSQDQSNQNLDNILVSLNFSYAYQPATDNIVIDANGHVNIDSEILGIHKADVLVSIPSAVNWHNSENAPYNGTAVYTENSIATTTPARLLLDVLDGTGLGSVQLNLDLDGNGANDGSGSTYTWVALAGAY